jgi:hypothetical protein
MTYNRQAGKSTRETARKRRLSVLWIGLIGIVIIIVVGALLQNSKALGIGGIGILVLLILLRILPDFIEGRIDKKFKEEKRAIRGAKAEEKVGEVRSNSTDDIACWFIDTDYNEETFIVRHAYFTGADQPYEKLQRALPAEIDESAWGALYSTTSYPFGPPETGKIAVKVINHYGDEVLKVYEV